MERGIREDGVWTSSAESKTERNIRVLIGMVFLAECPVGSFNVLLCGRSRDFKELVVIFRTYCQR